MTPYALSNFYETVRTLLNDGGDAVNGWDFPDAQLSAGLRSVVRMGFLPCLALSSGANPETLTDAPPNPDTWGYLAAKAAHLMIGGGMDENIKTRAISISVNPVSRRDAVTFIETMLSDLDARGNLCGSATDTSHKGLFATQGDVITYVAICPPPIISIPCCE